MVSCDGSIFTSLSSPMSDLICIECVNLYIYLPSAD